MTDTTLFTAGSLFTSDYLTHAITDTADYAAVDTIELAAKLGALVDAFPAATQPNEAQTEDDLIWLVFAALGWVDMLRQQNLTVSGRQDVPDGLLFRDAAAKAQANGGAYEWQRYGHGLAVVESKRWARPLDRAGRRDEATAPSTQMLRYLRRIDDLTRGRLRWDILPMVRAGGCTGWARVPATCGSGREHWSAGPITRKSWEDVGSGFASDRLFPVDRIKSRLQALKTGLCQTHVSVWRVMT